MHGRIYGFEKRVGVRRFPAGTASSAPSDGGSTWLGKTYRYIVENPDFFSFGDIWGVLPERTEGVFADETSFLPHADGVFADGGSFLAYGGGIQSNYAAFFRDLKSVSELAFSAIGKRVVCGLSANNYTEAKSGWLSREFFDDQGFIAIDYYGSERTPRELEADMRLMHGRFGKPVFIQEWSDFWHSQVSIPERAAYLRQIYACLLRLQDDGILAGFNYWGGWDNTTESVVVEDAAGFRVNWRGEILREFFAESARRAGARRASCAIEAP